MQYFGAYVEIIMEIFVEEILKFKCEYNFRPIMLQPIENMYQTEDR